MRIHPRDLACLSASHRKNPPSPADVSAQFTAFNRIPRIKPSILSYWEAENTHSRIFQPSCWKTRYDAPSGSTGEWDRHGLGQGRVSFLWDM